MQGKQAKIVSPTQERAILGYLATTRYPARDHVMSGARGSSRSPSLSTFRQTRMSVSV
jgi:hypothetical protein